MNPKRDIRIYRESITPVHTPFLQARIWREESEVPASKTELIASATAVLVDMNRTIEAMAEAILRLPNVNAVEVTHYSGNGAVFYADWP